MSLTRRAWLAAALAAPVTRGRARGAPRLVALDWGWAATAVRLGVAPVGVAETRLYRDWVRAPALPKDAVEVGLRADPSLDTLAALRPDLILTNVLDEALAPQLERIAPTLANPTFAENREPLANAKSAARLLGERLDRKREAATLVDEAESAFARAAQRLAAWRGRAFLPLSVIDARHAVAYGDGSMFVDVLKALGLAGAWRGATNLWGSKTIAIEALAAAGSGDLLVIEPLPAAAALFNPDNLFGRLCAADRRSVRRLPPAWGFGDLTAAVRFAGFLADALET